MSENQLQRVALEGLESLASDAPAEWAVRFLNVCTNRSEAYAVLQAVYCRGHLRGVPELAREVLEAKLANDAVRPMGVVAARQAVS